MRGSSMRYRIRLASEILAAAILVGVIGAPPSSAQSSMQNSAAAPSFEYEVATIKAYKPGAGEGPGVIRVGIMNAPDGFSASGATMQMLVAQAYGIQDFQIVGAPDWFDHDRFEINAKMENSVADALAKLSQEDRALTRQKMLQALLTDRFKLTIHRENKELPAYTLAIGKNGTKLVEAPPADPNAAAPSGAGPGRGGPSRGGMSMSSGPAGVTVNASAVPMTSLIRMLSQFLHGPVLDNTGLKGNYDIALKFTPENFGGSPGAAPSGVPNGATPPDPSTDPVGPSLPVAVQEQLGLKLEKGKGQVEIIVIDHVEKASDN